MKNFIVLCITVALGYLGYDALHPPPPPLPLRVAAAVPAPAIAPKVYFHSALDAPTMQPGMTSGASYFSTDSDSRFSPNYSYGGTVGYLDRGPTYIVVPGGGKSAPASPSSSTGTVGQARQNQILTYLRENVARATPNPNGAAR